MEQPMEPSLQGMKQGQPPQAGPVPEPQEQPPGDGGDPDIEEFKRGAAAIGEALYNNKNVSDSILQGIDPNDKAGSTARQTITLVTQIDNKLNLELSAIFSVAAWAFGEMVELSSAMHKIEYSEKEQQDGVMAVFEGLIQSYEIDPQEFANFTGGASDSDQQQAMSMYEGAMSGKEAAANG